MSKFSGMAWPVDMTNNVTLNQFRPYEDSDETHYWIDIHGVRLPLTKSQFVAMHDARIQLWDMATERTEQRIIKLLESKLCWCVGQPLNEENGREELMKHMNCDWEAMMIEYHVALIKGEK